VRRLVVALLVAAGVAASVGVANADPITCPPGQTSAKVNNVFVCVNNGGNADNSADPRNPNR
jgi:hypothetical protein